MREEEEGRAWPSAGGEGGRELGVLFLPFFREVHPEHLLRVKSCEGHQAGSDPDSAH